MKTITLELTESEMRDLAEMTALSLSMLSLVKAELNATRAETWQRLGAALMKAARGVPSIGRDMELHPDLRHWFFNSAYVDTAFYSELLDEFRDSVFWQELVGRMADHVLENALPPAELEQLPEKERSARIASLESALWNEVTHHGLDRLLFLLPEEES